jgi:1,4-dihydroxy-2-naphthoate octaprenyltransferase
MVVAVMVPMIGALAQEAPPSRPLWWSVAVLFLIHLAMMLAFELPDLESDGLAGKRVLAVRIGRRRTVVLILALLAGAGVMLAALGNRLPGAGGALLAGILPASLLVVSIARRMDRTLTISAVATLVTVAAGLLVGAVGG